MKIEKITVVEGSGFGFTTNNQHSLTFLSLMFLSVTVVPTSKIGFALLYYT